MPLEVGVWRIDGALRRVEFCGLDVEARLEEFLHQDIRIVSPEWMVIGRQVHTIFGKFIDLLAIDRDGNLVVLELKKDRTPRDVVAQLLDYASYVKDLKDDEIAGIYDDYLRRFHPERQGQSLDQAFKERFGVDELPEALNEAHQLVVVASQLDESTERIVNYLAEVHGVPINALFFRVFRDEGREYLSSMWFIDPSLPSPCATAEEKEPWNGEFYVSFGHDERGRNWADAVKYGFVSGGGGRWYSKTLNQLEPGKRVWVNVPRRGYVGVGIVQGEMVRVDEFAIADGKGQRALRRGDVAGKGIFDTAGDGDRAEYLVPVKWVKTFGLDEAVKEKGFFGNQNTVCKPTTKRWGHTVERLKVRFGVE